MPENSFTPAKKCAAVIFSAVIARSLLEADVGMATVVNNSPNIDRGHTDNRSTGNSILPLNQPNNKTRSLVPASIPRSGRIYPPASSEEPASFVARAHPPASSEEPASFVARTYRPASSEEPTNYRCQVLRPNVTAGRIDACSGITDACARELAAGSCALSNLAACGRWESATAATPSFQDWAWRPRHCRLTRMSVNSSRDTGDPALCGVLRRMGVKRFLVVGDSLSFAMVQQLWESTPKSANPRGTMPRQFWVGNGPWRGLLCPPDARRAGAAGAPVYLEFVRADCLLTPASRARLVVTRSMHECTASEAERNIPPSMRWLQLLQERAPPELVMLNAGAHFHETAEFAATLADAATAVNVSTFRQRGGTLILRNTPAGHGGCADFSAPLSPEAFAATYEGPGGRTAASAKWRRWWGAIPEFNELLDRHARTAGGGLRGPLLDVDTATRLRPDGHASPKDEHPDCLHYRGNHSAYAHWCDLFLSLLLELEAQAKLATAQTASPEGA